MDNMLAFAQKTAHAFFVRIKTAAPAAVRFLISHLSHLLWLFAPILSFLMVEYMIGNLILHSPTSRLDWLQVLLNLIWYYMIAGFLFLLIGRRALSAGVGLTLFWLIGNLEHYVYQFRWRVIFPSDLLAAGTALSVADNYNFDFSAEQVVCAAAMFAFVYLLLLLPRQKQRRIPRKRFTLPLIGISAAYLLVFNFTPFLNAIGLGGDIWEAMWDTKRNGIVLNFMINVKNLRIERPEGYSVAAVEALSDESGPFANGGANPVEDRLNRPNVVVIMNEAFSDLSVLGDIDTTADPLPFVHSLKENTIKGTAYSSVFGGHTANSEYEFITGNTTAFLPSGTVPFQMYVERGDYSLGSQLKELGYQTAFLHPYYSTGWNRRNVYQYFGFDEILFRNDFIGAKNIRDYVSDKSNYQNLIRLYARNTENTPAFLFNVTMQNHGGYSDDRQNLDMTVKLAGDLAGKYDNVDTYLSLIRESDKAFEELIGYFREAEKPTIVLLFGDHQPNLGDAFYNDVFGKSQDALTPEENARKYGVPFLIWANYDIDEQEGVETSLNYLSTLLVKTAGLPMTGYQEFLSELSKRIPVLTNVQFKETNGEWTNQESELSAPSRRLLHTYQVLQYNGISDEERRDNDLFFLIREQMLMHFK